MLVAVFLAVPLGLFGTCAAIGVVASLAGGFDPGTFGLYGMLTLAGIGGMVVAVRWANRLWGNR